MTHSANKKHKKKNNHRLSDKYDYVGVHDTETNIRLTQYNENVLHTKNVQTTESRFSKLTHPDVVNWFQISGLTDSDVITRIVQECGLNNLDAKDILTPQHIIKIEEYHKRLLLILNSSYYDENNELHSEHISIVVTENIVITFTESNNPVFDRVMDALKDDLLHIRKRGTGLLLAFLLNTIVVNLVESASKVQELLEEIEDQLLDTDAQKKNFGSDIQQRRRDYMVIRKNSQPLKEQFPKLLRSESGLITPDMLPVYTDLSDQIQFIIQTNESNRDIISSLVDLYISNNDMRMNAIMKQLTVVSTLFIPLTFLVGVWGMNFAFMPELNWPHGYAIAWLAIFVVGGLTWYFMKRKGY
ncbi:magnesium/cobalt transporter CorA [Parabacteroides sp. PF5-9]|uniref:magnesium/cobalt transporter CorA n=1 Tax=Parabacteroides sp. PF5-9 TaxID=1742404 RepID=UPI0024759404|nr:magnesium/cobalt transporter CorA [Parabacteroides sp. PF5-9]MDH6358532.1 magnesium transporter [Parabacteroides sp. PF5-9]